MLAQRIPLYPYISLHDICTGCFLTGYIYLRNWVKLGHFLWELNSRPSRSSGESFGADLPPQVIKGPKSARFYRVKQLTWTKALNRVRFVFDDFWDWWLSWLRIITKALNRIHCAFGKVQSSPHQYAASVWKALTKFAPTFNENCVHGAVMSWNGLKGWASRNLWRPGLRWKRAFPARWISKFNL